DRVFHVGEFFGADTVTDDHHGGGCANPRLGVGPVGGGLILGVLTRNTQQTGKDHPVAVERMFGIGVVIDRRVGALIGPANQIGQLVGGHGTILGVKQPG